MGETVTIISRKFDDRIHRTWQAELIEDDGQLLTFVGVFDDDVTHPHLGFIRRGTISYEYYWLDRWYNVFRFHEPGGTLRNYYCNINMPPKFGNNILEYVDLDIDVLVWPDIGYDVLDLDEFESNISKFNYHGDLIISAKTGLNDVIDLVERAQFPFDFGK